MHHQDGKYDAGTKKTKDEMQPIAPVQPPPKSRVFLLNLSECESNHSIIILAMGMVSRQHPIVLKTDFGKNFKHEITSHSCEICLLVGVDINAREAPKTHLGQLATASLRR